MKPTYVLFVPGTHGPTVHHTTLEDARTEAKRLVESGCGTVMICEFIEGVERVTTTKKLKKNPLVGFDEGPIF